MVELDKLSVEQMVKGLYADEGGNWICACCGKTFSAGEIFKIEKHYYTAERAAQLHMEAEHPDRLGDMLQQENKYLTLTAHQKELLELFAAGLTDAEVAERLGVTASTVRHQRFVFREKAKAAKTYLAVWELASRGFAGSRASQREALMEVPSGARMVDERFEVTEEENKKILDTVFTSLEPLKLRVFSSKAKKKVVILTKIAGQFERGKRYTEKEVNAILQDIFDDYVTLRRYLIEYGFMDRTRDCRMYWLR